MLDPEVLGVCSILAASTHPGPRCPRLPSSSEGRLRRNTTGQRRLRSALVALSALVFISACGFPWFTIDRFGEGPALRMTAVAGTLRETESGLVLVEGRVTHLYSLCDTGEGNCYIALDADDVPIFVYYRVGIEWEECLDPDIDEQVARIEQWEVVKVRGYHLGSGNLSICGSPEFYIQKVAPE